MSIYRDRDSAKLRDENGKRNLGRENITMTDFFKKPFDFNGDGKLDPFELGTAFMIFDECTKDDDEEDDDSWFDDEKDDDDWDSDDDDDEEDDW